MNRTSLLATIATVALAATTAQAQMRVEGFRTPDPRLKQQRIDTPALNAPLPNAVQGADVPVASTPTKTVRSAPRSIVPTPAARVGVPAGTRTPVPTTADSAVQIPKLVVPTEFETYGPVQARNVQAPIQGGQSGPLQRPTYLQPEQGQTTAGGPSALDLMKQCFDGSISGAIGNPSCVGYMAGFVGAIRISASIGPGYPICLPENGLSNESIVSDVSSYLEENAPSLQKSARSVVFLVLSKRYPCATK
jgi:hypothetical protein